MVVQFRVGIDTYRTAWPDIRQFRSETWNNSRGKVHATLDRACGFPAHVCHAVFVWRPEFGAVAYQGQLQGQPETEPAFFKVSTG